VIDLCLLTRVLTAKLTPPQEEAWDKLRSAVGGGGLILPRDSDVLRFVIAEACKRFGVAWPGEQTSTPPQNRSPSLLRSCRPRSPRLRSARSAGPEETKVARDDSVIAA
jgi:hypothetical protein